MKTTDFSNFQYYENIMILTEEDLLKNLQRIERVIRSSKEYKDYIACTRETDDIKGCSFFTEKNLEECTLEIHHIVHLADLVIIAGKKLLKSLPEQDCLLCMDIAKEVLLMHFKDLIPVISLTKTIHELYHAGQYTLPKKSKQLHLGDYKKFLEEYREFLDKEYIKKLYTYFGIDEKELDTLLNKEV